MYKVSKKKTKIQQKFINVYILVMLLDDRCYIMELSLQTLCVLRAAPAVLKNFSDWIDFFMENNLNFSG